MDLEEHSARRPTVAIVDDDVRVLRSIGRALATHGYDVSSFASPMSLLANLSSLAPSCVIVDLLMPGLTGLDVQRSLRKSGSTWPVIFITGHGDIRTSVRAMLDGAVDFLTKPIDLDDLLQAVDRAVARSRSVRERDHRLELVRRRAASLTPRERQVFGLVVAGLLNKQIAANLGITEKTVKVHRGRVMQKMAVRSLADLVRAAGQLETGRASRDCAGHSARAHHRSPGRISIDRIEFGI